MSQVRAHLQYKNKRQPHAIPRILSTLTYLTYLSDTKPKDTALPLSLTLTPQASHIKTHTSKTSSSIQLQQS
jgi:hypothetical protein